jgi:hypothetical protein
VETYLERGVQDCISNRLPPALLKGKIELQLQLNFFKQIYTTEKSKRVSLEKEFNKLYHISGTR